jgi:hypothetical protein
MEWFSRSNRRSSYVISQIGGHLTGLCLPIIAYFNRDYQGMHIWAAIMSAAALPTYFFIPESPRWLACNQRSQEAEEIIMVWQTSSGEKTFF